MEKMTRVIDIGRDKDYYDNLHKAPETPSVDPLDLYRHRIALNICRHVAACADEEMGGVRLLNVGGGFGKEAFFLLSKRIINTLVLCDRSPSQLFQSKKYLAQFPNVYRVCGDGERLPLKDDAFDICWIIEALHHLEDPRRGIDECIRATKKAIIIDEPSGGRIRAILNRVFIVLGIKEEHERGYLEAFRIDRHFIADLCRAGRIKAVYFPYFIYYFEWYKKCRNVVIKSCYAATLRAVNFICHNFGNRAIVVLFLKSEHETN